MKLFFLTFAMAVLSGCGSPLSNQVRDLEGSSKATTQQNFSQNPYKVDSIWTAGPYGSIQQNSKLIVFVKDSEDNLVDIPDELILNFYATMPSMGHGLEEAGFFVRIAQGIYQNNDIKFNMPGEWKMELWLQDENFDIQDRLSWFATF